MIKLNLSLITIIAFLFLSCSKQKNAPVSTSNNTNSQNDTTSQGKTTSPPVQTTNIYIVGCIDSAAVLWKNGVSQNLFTVQSATSSVARSILVQKAGNNAAIYMTGYYDAPLGATPSSICWENTNGINYLSTTPYNVSGTITNTIYLDNSGTIYIGAHSFDAEPLEGAFLWKGPNWSLTAYGKVNSSVNAICVYNDDLYTAGEDGDTKTLYASYYKNGTQILLTDPTASPSQSNDIAVTSGGVYVIGSTSVTGNICAALWQNGKLQLLSSNHSAANSIYLSGSDVYVGGWDAVNGVTTATIWKNGVATHLQDMGEGSVCFKIVVSESDVYAVGEMKNANGDNIATFWKNGVPTQLSKNNSHAFGLCVSQY